MRLLAPALLLLSLCACGPKPEKDVRIERRFTVWGPVERVQRFVAARPSLKALPPEPMEPNGESVELDLPDRFSSSDVGDLARAANAAKLSYKSETHQVADDVR